MDKLTPLERRILEYLHGEKNPVKRTSYAVRVAIGGEKNSIEKTLDALQKKALIEFQGDYYSLTISGVNNLYSLRQTNSIINIGGNVGPGAVVGSGSVTAQNIAGGDIHAEAFSLTPRNKELDEGTLKIDWGEAIDLGPIYGRNKEMSVLENWIKSEKCRLVTILGMGGIGKTALAIQLVQNIKDGFEYVFWRDLRNAPLLEDVLDDCLKFLYDQEQITFPQSLNTKISLLIELLRIKKCLIVFDNSEAILREGTDVGHYREGYEPYGTLIKRCGETSHQSCFIITSRERLKELVLLEGDNSPVKSLYLTGLDEVAGRDLLKDKSLKGTDDTWKNLVQSYSGHPLALKLVSSTIKDLFGGDINTFLREGVSVFGGIRDLLNEQFNRLSELEQTIMYWLAIEREAVTIRGLQKDITYPISFSKAKLLEMLQSLRDRHIIEVDSNAQFTLLPVVMEFMTSRLISAICEEIDSDLMALFINYALMKAQAKDYIMNAQIRLILDPILGTLLSSYGKESLVHKLEQIITTLQDAQVRSTGYAAGNVLNLFRQLGIEVQGRNFSGLTIWQAYLRESDLRDVDFSYGDLTGAVFTEAFGRIISVALSVDGRLLAAGTADSNVRLWDAKSFEYLQTFVGHDDWVRTVQFSPDGRLLATGSCDNSARLWEVSSGECLKILTGHSRWIRALVFSPDSEFLVTSSEDTTIKLWDVQSGKCIRTLEGHTDWIRTVAISPDGQIIASGGSDKTLRLWKVRNGECIEIVDLENWVWATTFSPDGRFVAVGCNDNVIRLWNIEKGAWDKTLYGHANSIWSLCYTKDEILFSGSEDQTIRMWNTNSERCLRTFQGHTNSVRSVVVSYDGSLVVSGGEDQTVRMWNGNTGQSIKVFQGFNSWIWAVACSTDGKVFASASNDTYVRLWDINDGSCLKTFRGHDNPVWAVTFSPNDRFLASGGEDLTVRIWEIKTGKCIQILRGHESWIRWVSFNSDSTLLASACSDQTIKLWDVKSGKCLKTLRGHTNPVWSAIFSADDSLVISASDDHTIRVWDVDTGECSQVIEGHTKRVSSAMLNQTGDLIVSCSEDQTIKIWVTATGEQIKTFYGHTDWIRSANFSPDGRLIASSSNDKTVRLWDFETGECLKTMEGHKDRVRSVVFGLDGAVLISGSDDETVKIWDVANGECIKTLRSDRPYERMNITGISGISKAQKVSLLALGAIDQEESIFE